MLKSTIILAVLFAALLPGALATFDYVGTNDKYHDIMEESYKHAAPPEIGLLEISCFFWEDRVTITPTIDNVTELNIEKAVLAAIDPYMAFYGEHKYPGKAEIFVNKAGGAIGTQIGSGTIYSKWVDDLKYDQNGRPTNESWGIFFGKVRDTIRVYEWNY